MKTPRTLPLKAALLMFGLTLPGWLDAQTNWTGGTIGPHGNDVAVAANWGGTPLTGNGTEDVVFGVVSAANAAVYIGDDVGLHNITFDGGASRPAYTFDGDGDGSALYFTGNLDLGIGGNVSFNGSLDVYLTGNHTVNLATGTKLTVNSRIYEDSMSSGSTSITQTGNGAVVLGKSNYFSEYTLSGGTLLVGADYATGTGTLNMAAGTTLGVAVDGNEYEIHSDVYLTGNATFGKNGSRGVLHSYGELDSGSGAGITLNVTGDILVLHGTTGSNFGGFAVGNGGALVFDGHQSLPTAAGSVTAATGSYVGMSGDFAQNEGYETSFLAKLIPGDFKGTIGFDSDDHGDYGTINLTNFTHSDFAGLATINNGFLNSGVNVIAPGSGAHAGVLQFSALNHSLFKIDAPLIDAHGYFNGSATVLSVIVGRNDSLGDNGTVNFGVDNTYTGGTTVLSGTLLLSCASTPAGIGTITVHSGATLATESGTSISNNLVLNSGSRLAGNGSYNQAAIGGGAILAPGMKGTDSLGHLNFEDLELAGGGVLELHVRYNGEGGVAYDSVDVQSPDTLTISATSGNPFTLKLISLNSDYTPGAFADGSLLSGTFALDFLSANGISGVFALGSNLVIDASELQTGGTPTFNLVQSGNDFTLNFTPVPEPSTYALIAIGLGLVGVTAWRKRRA